MKAEDRWALADPSPALGLPFDRFWFGRPFAWWGWRKELMKAREIVGGMVGFAHRDLRGLLSLRSRAA